MSTDSTNKKQDDLSSLFDLITPEWAVTGGPDAALAQPGDDLWSSFNFDLAKEMTFLGEYPTYPDISAILPPIEEQPATTTTIDTHDIFPPASLPHPLVAVPSLAAFSVSSASPAETASPNNSAVAPRDDAPSLDAPSESDSDSAADSEEFAPVRRPTATQKSRASATRGKRAATKPKPYPRISDVVRDAPQKLSDGNRRPSASTELKGSIRSADAIDDDWRPTLEEYQRMSSREKRQLRNKISARNFRVRRKEYISTLEGEVATRDEQIQVYKEELSTTKSENNELKKEIERLRKAILEGRTGNLFDKAAANEASPSTSVLSQNNTKARNTRSSLAKANRNKDLPSTGSRNGFWGGSVLGSGATPVHTTLIPDFDVSTLSGKPKALAPLQENLNPLLNSRLLPNPTLPSSTSLTGFDGFVDTNSFTYKTLESYRMQLWQKMAREAGAAQNKDHSSFTASSPPSSSPSSAWSSSSLGIASAQVGPHYFTSPKHSLAVVKAEDTMTLNPVQAAAAATAVSQTIVGKLSGAFWDAFSPKPPVSLPKSSSTTSAIDVDKVRKVLEGKAVLRVVDVDSNIAQLEEGMKAVSLVSGRKSPSLKRSASSNPSVETLEEGLKSMGLNQCRMQAKECASTAVLGIFSQPMRAGHAPSSIATTSHIGRAVAAQH